MGWGRSAETSPATASTPSRPATQASAGHLREAASAHPIESARRGVTRCVRADRASVLRRGGRAARLPIPASEAEGRPPSTRCAHDRSPQPRAPCRGPVVDRADFDVACADVTAHAGACHAGAVGDGRCGRSARVSDAPSSMRTGPSRSHARAVGPIERKVAIELQQLPPLGGVGGGFSGRAEAPGSCMGGP